MNPLTSFNPLSIVSNSYQVPSFDIVSLVWLVLFIGFVFFVVVIALREVFLWYTGANKVISLLEEIRDSLKK